MPRALTSTVYMAQNDRPHLFGQLVLSAWFSSAMDSLSGGRRPLDGRVWSEIVEVGSLLLYLPTVRPRPQIQYENLYRPRIPRCSRSVLRDVYLSDDTDKEHEGPDHQADRPTR